MGILDRFSEGGAKISNLESILENLNCILNTKKGFGSLIEEFGVGDYNAFKGRREIVTTLVAEIEENIARYEPRVCIESIKEVDSELSNRLRFEMKCRILNTPKPLFINFDTAYAKVEVEED